MCHCILCGEMRISATLSSGKTLAKQHPFSFQYKLLLCQHRCHGNRSQHLLCVLGTEIISMIMCYIKNDKEYDLFCHVYSLNVQQPNAICVLLNFGCYSVCETLGFLAVFTLLTV